jgi:lipase
MPQDMRGGFPTHWTRSGSGPRQALLIHCSLGHAGGWSGMMAGLDDVVSALAFDLPGHGRSGDWDKRGDLQEVSMAMAVDLLEDQAQGQPVDIIGHSFGGTVGLRLAVERPELVRSMVLIEPVFFAAGLADRPDLKAPYDLHMGAYSSALQAGDMTAAARAFTGVWGDGRAWDALPEGQKQAMVKRIHLIAEGAPAIYHDAAGLLSGGRLEHIAVPVLLVEGGSSPAYIDAINTALARRIGKAERLVVPGAGHMLPITHPKPVADAVRAFLQRIPAA